MSWVSHAGPRRPFLDRAFGPMGHGSLRGCIISLIFSALGAGILSLPWAIARLGLVVGVLVLICSAMFSYATMEMLVVCGHIRNKSDYADTMADMLGSPGATLVNVIVAVDSAGAICVFYKYMAGSVQMLAASLGYDISLSVIVVALSFGVIFPLSLPRRITALQYVTMASVIPLAVVVGVIVGRCPALTSQKQIGNMLLRTDLISIEAAQACSAIFFSFMCHMNVWAICNELDNPLPHRTSKLFRRVVCFLVCVYGAVGIAGAVSFGDATPPNVLEAYPASDAFNVVAHGLMCVMLMVCSVLCVHPVRHALANMLGYDTSAFCNADGVTPVHTPKAVLTPSFFPGGPTLPRVDSHASSMDSLLQPPMTNGSKDNSVGTAVHFILTLAVIAVTCTVAVLVPSIVDLLGVLGGFCGVALMFVLPTFIYACTRPGIRAVLSTAVTCIFCIIGFSAAVGSMAS